MKNEKEVKEKTITPNWQLVFMEWLTKIAPWGKVSEYVQFKSLPPEEWVKGKMGPFSTDTRTPIPKNSLSVRLFTKDNVYNLVAKEEYLGCTVSKRKPRAGEITTRGMDLPDGKFSEKTLERIMMAMTQNELVKVSRPLSTEGIAASQAMNSKEMEGFERFHSRYHDKKGKQFYAEWLQRGEEIREHKVYELVGESN